MLPPVTGTNRFKVYPSSVHIALKAASKPQIRLRVPRKKRRDRVLKPF